VLLHVKPVTKIFIKIHRYPAFFQEDSTKFRRFCTAFQAGYTFTAFPESPSTNDCESGYDRAALRAAFSVVPYISDGGLPENPAFSA